MHAAALFAKVSAGNGKKMTSKCTQSKSELAELALEPVRVLRLLQSMTMQCACRSPLLALCADLA